MYRITVRRGRASGGQQMSSDAMTTASSSLRRRRLAGLAAVAVAASLVVVGASSASAASSTVSDASFSWALSDAATSGAPFGGCNFLSAGTAGNTGSSRVWSQADNFYSTATGNVTVTKPDCGGAYTQPTWATKCQTAAGATLTTATSSASRVNFSAGTGTVDPGTNTASIHWTGSFTSAFYGGLIYWSATDPTLTVNADGSAALTATISGYGASMTDPNAWNVIAPTSVTLANLTGVTVTSTGFTVTPAYVGVAITTPAGAPPQSLATAATAGSFPQSFVDFQQVTGESS
jgi:hypothetical protein